MEQISFYNKILSLCTFENSPIILGGLKIYPVHFHFTRDTAPRSVPVHTHCFAELSWMIDGKMDYQFGDILQILSADEKNFIFIPPETSHQRICQANSSVILGFLLDLVPQNETGKLFFDKIVKFLAENNYSFGNLAFMNEFEVKLLAELNAVNTVFIGKINFYIYEFLFKLFSHYFAADLIHNFNTHNMSYGCDDLVAESKQMIEECLSASISQKTIARKFNISVRHLNRIFSEQTGCSIGRYIIQRKLNAAQKMLHNPSFSVKEIADSLGFRSNNYFCAFFKRQTGMTPLEYAKSASKQ